MSRTRQNAHTKYEVDGQPVPGVTAVLGVLNKPALIPWAWNLGRQGIDLNQARQQALDAGTLAHYLCECSIKNQAPEPDYITEFPATAYATAQVAFTAFESWRKQSGIILEWTEVALVSKQWSFGGTLDIAGRREGVTVIVDLKTSKQIYPEYRYQVAAYERLWLENHPNDPVAEVLILKLGKDDGAFATESLSIQERDRSWDIFRHCLEIYRLQSAGK